MTPNFSFDQNDSRQYLQMLQDIINRLANNSSNCKTWMITIFTAMVALLVGVPEIRPWVGIVIVPTILFYLLDGYYLALENDYRDLEKEYINKLHSRNDDCSMSIYNFDVSSVGGYHKKKNLKKGLMSNATWPLYVTLGVLCFILCVVFIVIKPVEQKVQDIEKPLKELVQKQNSMINTMELFIEKYEPVKVESKSFYNSSFFQAGNIDSVAVNLYKGEIKN